MIFEQRKLEGSFIFAAIQIANIEKMNDPALRNHIQYFWISVLKIRIHQMLGGGLGWKCSNRVYYKFSATKVNQLSDY